MVCRCTPCSKYLLRVRCGRLVYPCRLLKWHALCYIFGAGRAGAAELTSLHVANTAFVTWSGTNSEQDELSDCNCSIKEAVIPFRLALRWLANPLSAPYVHSELDYEVCRHWRPGPDVYRTKTLYGVCTPRYFTVSMYVDHR